MLRGTVRWFNKNFGYGFIEAEDKQDVFVHYSAIEGEGHRSLKRGEEVHYEHAETEEGLRATKVQRSDGG